MMNSIHNNLFILLPKEKRNLVDFYFDLNVVGEEYARGLGDLADQLADVALSKDDEGYNTVISPILRAGKSVSDRISKRLPKAEIAEICMRRNIHTLKPMVAWNQYDGISNKEIKKLIITDPALATGGSLIQALDLAISSGFREENILVFAMFGCDSGLSKVFGKYPNIKIYLAHKADGIREDGYLLPYNGDTGDRLYGVRENEYVF
ncbi:MAG: uracil phosphoribosyltransferase [Erysipelotrichaceae bacterium]|nr:uracil phosphoribosyltransferase [Erysipelotrichaceae bacterium]